MEQEPAPETNKMIEVLPEEVALNSLRRNYAGHKYGIRKGEWEYGFGPLVEGAAAPDYNGRKYGIRRNGRVILSFGPKIAEGERR